jgi:hypothetical protein
MFNLPQSNEVSMRRNSQKVNSKPTGYHVTTHALRRYITRVLGWRVSDRLSDEDVVRSWERVNDCGRDVLRAQIAMEIHCKVGPPQRALPAYTCPISFGRAVIEQGYAVVTVFGRGA